jgi:hypothetical protein
MGGDPAVSPEGGRAGGAGGIEGEDRAAQGFLPWGFLPGAGT